MRFFHQNWIVDLMHLIKYTIKSVNKDTTLVCSYSPRSFFPRSKHLSTIQKVSSGTGEIHEIEVILTERNVLLQFMINLFANEPNLT